MSFKFLQTSVINVVLKIFVLVKINEHEKHLSIKALFNFVFKFKKSITYSGQFEMNRAFVRAKFRKRLEPSHFVENAPVNNDRLGITDIM